MYKCWVMVVAFHNILSFMKKIKKCKILPRPYVGRYSGEKAHQFLQEKWIFALSKLVEIFIMVSISDVPSIKYWHHLGKIMDTTKENIP